MRIRITGVLAALLAAMTLATASASADGLFTNGTRIPINATPTSSAIAVSGQTGRVTKVEVTLRKLIHPMADDADILLVSPDGRTSVVMSDVCRDVPGFTWTFTEDATRRMEEGPDDCGELRYRPTEGGNSDDAFPGAPAGRAGFHRSTFDDFLGGLPNGTWRLFVGDDVPSSNDGSIELGWALRIETAEADAVVPGNPGSYVADPYPLMRTVSGMGGVIEDVDVKLPGVYHERPVNLNVLLVGPRGQRVTLMSDACLGPAVRDYAWTFDDEAPDAMPADTCVNGARYKPTDLGFFDAFFPAPAPPDLYEASLSAFDSTDPNGDWQLYVTDDTPAEWDGFLAQRFELQIATRPAAAVSFAEGAVEVAEGEQRKLTLTRPAAGRSLGRGAVTVTSAPLTATSGEDFKPLSTTVEFAPRQTTRTITVETPADAVAEPAEAFTLTIGQPTGDAAVATNASATVTISGQETAGRVPGGDPDTVPVDREAPVIGRITLAPAAFAVGRSRSAGRAPRRTTIRFALSEPATLTLQIQRAKGRRLLTVGTLRRAGRAGANRIAFAGRIGRHTLRRGRYRLTVRAVDTAGNRATAPPRRFRII